MPGGAGIAGRVSQRQTVVEGHTVTQGYTWNDLGLIASMGYPDTNLLNNTSQEPTRSVTYSYSNGFLTSIPSYAGTISYRRAVTRRWRNGSRASGPIDTMNIRLRVSVFHGMLLLP